MDVIWITEVILGVGLIRTIPILQLLVAIGLGYRHDTASFHSEKNICGNCL